MSRIWHKNLHDDYGIGIITNIYKSKSQYISKIVVNFEDHGPLKK